MSLSAAVLDALVAAGATTEQIVAAMKADIADREAQEEAKLEEKRAGNRERQRRKRERDAAVTDVTDVTRDACDERDETSPLTPPLKSSPDPSKITPPISPQPHQGARARFDAPSGVSVEQWAAFRKQRKKPLNERSYVLLCNKLRDLADAGWPPGEMIDRAIERGWETVFEPKDQRHDRPVQTSRTAETIAILNRDAERSAAGYG